MSLPLANIYCTGCDFETRDLYRPIRIVYRWASGKQLETGRQKGWCYHCDDYRDIENMDPERLASDRAEMERQRSEKRARFAELSKGFFAGIRNRSTRRTLRYAIEGLDEEMQETGELLDIAAKPRPASPPPPEAHHPRSRPLPHFTHRPSSRPLPGPGAHRRPHRHYPCAGVLPAHDPPQRPAGTPHWTPRRIPPDGHRRRPTPRKGHRRPIPPRRGRGRTQAVFLERPSFRDVSNSGPARLGKHIHGNRHHRSSRKR